MTTPTASDSFAPQLAELHSALLRFAQLQLRNQSLAEDVVQETLVAALEKPQNFSGRSALKTWVIGILKHKIIDALRRQGREMNESSLSNEENETDVTAFENLFDATGHWAAALPDWGNPDKTLERVEFFQVLELCIEKLPANVGRAFMMREWLELETVDICKELQISTTNCWVLLHRARLRLRECLQLNWFGEEVSAT